MEQDYRKKLDQEFERVESKQRDLNSKELINANTLAEAKSKMMQQMFSIMKEMGVNMEDLASIRGFLEKLRLQDPDLHELFEFAFNGLTQETPDQMVSGQSGQPLQPGQPGQPPQMGEENAGLMDKYKNLGQDILRQ